MINRWQDEPGFQLVDNYVTYFTAHVLGANRTLPGAKLTHQIIDIPDVDFYKNIKNKVLLTNSHIQSGHLDTNYYEELAPSWYGIYNGFVEPEDIVPTHTYNCLINRMDVSRQGWLYQLIRNDLFDQGLVSFNMDTARADRPGTSAEIFEQQFLQSLSIFEPEHNFIKDRVPYRNFADALSMNGIVLQTKCSLVLETWHHDNRAITLTEKIFRCLKLPRPWIMHTMQHAVEHLRQMGFDVLDDLVDHSYDTIEHTIERQTAIIKVLKNVSAEPWTDAKFQRCKSAAIHNQQILNKFSTTYCADILQSIENAKNKCLQIRY